MRSFLLLFISLLSSSAIAAPLYYLVPKEVSMEGFRIEDKRDPFWDNLETKKDESWKYGAAAHIDFELLRFEMVSLYWKNRFHMASTKHQVRETGWQWEVGLNVADKVEFFHYHHSQHFLDYKYSGEGTGKKYPLHNWYGFRLILIRDP